jgi:predicted 3-demethylubiquinone-9 3-methyltransferase (glyoxalase superfamily)
MNLMQKIVPNLWFDGDVKEVMDFYTGIFKNAKVGNVSYYGDAGPLPAGTVLIADFELDGMQFTAINGGPYTHFTPAISFLINCADQAEVDHYWDKLSAGGEVEQCGWLKDKYGISWQVVPVQLGQLMSGGDPIRTNRVMQAMLKMIKLDVAELQRAYDGG